MYKSIKEYYDFLKRQESERVEKLTQVKGQVNNQMDIYMSEHGWTRKGKSQKVFYTKQFNGKDVVVEYRCNYGKDFECGLPEFVHDKSIPNSVEKIQMGYFHWNDQDTSGWSLDVVMERMDVFYDKYTK